MAQDLLDRFTPLHHQPANVTGGATAVPVLFHGHTALKFPNASVRSAYFKSVMNTLMNNSGLIVTIEWFSSSITGLVSWTAAFERHPSGFRYDLGAQFAAGATASAAPTGTAYGAKYTTINFANGVAIASILILESYRLSITRSASDTLGADAYISTVSIRNLT